MQIKYLDKVSIAPTDVFFAYNKSGRERKYKSFCKALEAACKRAKDQYIFIYIYNEYGVEEIPENIPLPRMKYAKDVYGKYARWRTIWIDANKTRVLMESFGVSDIYCFDYDILYDENHELFKHGDQLLCNLKGFENRVVEYCMKILGQNNDEIIEFNRKNLLNAHVKSHNEEIRLAYEHYDDDMPNFYIFPSETHKVDTSKVKLTEIKLNESFESNDFHKYKYDGYDALISNDKSLVIIFASSELIWGIIKIPNTDLLMSIRYTMEKEDGKIRLIPHHWTEE